MAKHERTALAPTPKSKKTVSKAATAAGARKARKRLATARADEAARRSHGHVVSAKRSFKRVPMPGDDRKAMMLERASAEYLRGATVRLPTMET